MLESENTRNLVYSKLKDNRLKAELPLSVVIIAFNEEKNIGRCIDSVSAIAEEIIVLDSFSEDHTVDIAKQKGAIVTQIKFKGYIDQKNYALQLASHNLVLSLDADEALSKELTESISAIKRNAESRAYSMSRCTNYCGCFLRHGSWYPDRKTRLFDKRVAVWGGNDPHDTIVLKKGVEASRLKGDILHFSYGSIEEHISQNNRFSSIAAHALMKREARFLWAKIIINPIWAFIYGYIFRLGFLDGFYGFVVAVNVGHYTFMKYSKLYQLKKKK
jgi:glycosyltransferase involved in cell wall biosynthesis